MADDVARTSLTFDASGAQKGAADFKTAGEQIIAANQAVEASESKAAATVETASTRRTAARRAAAKSAQDTAAIEAAAASAGADSFDAATKRIMTGSDSQTKMLDRYAKQWDPFVAAVARAQIQLEKIMGVIAQGGPNAERASAMIGEATQRLNVAQANLSLGADAGRGIEQLTAKFAPAQASARAMGAELAQLNQALQLGVSIEGGYQAAWDRIVLSYDEGAAAAKRAAAAQQELIVQSKALQDAQNSQQNINQLTGVQTSPGSVGGVAVNPSKSASDSAAVFQAQFDQEEKLAAENARLAASYNPIKAASLAYAAALSDIDKAVARNIINEGQAEVARDRAAKTILDQAGLNRQLGLSSEAAAGGMGHLTNNTSGMTREFIVLGHEMIQGNFTRLTGSLLVMTEYMGGLRDKVFELGKALVTTAGGIAGLVGVAAIGALTALAISAENTALRIERLRNALALARPDFIATSAVAEAASRDLAKTTFLSTAESRAGVGAVFQALPNYAGTQSQLEAVVLTMARVSKAVHDGAVEWTDLSAALKSPSAYLETLGDKVKGVDQVFINHIKTLEDSGRKYQALNETLALLTNATKSQAANMRPLESALHNLGEAFITAGQNGKSFIDTIGTPITGALAGVVNAVTALINGMKEMNALFPGSALQSIMAFQFAGSPAAVSVGGLLGLRNPFASGGGAGASTQSLSGITAPASIAAPQYDVSQMASIVEKFVVSGSKLDDAVAYAANAMRESGGNFKAVNMADAPGGSHGLFQWNKSRLADFQSQNQGLLPEQTSDNAQVAFANWERTHGYAGVDAAVLGKTDLGAKTATVTAGYEVPKDIAGQSAISAAIANDFMKRFGAGAGNAGPIEVSASGGGGFGFTADPNEAIKKAEEYSKALGVSGEAAKAAQAKIDAFNGALVLKPGNAEYLEGLQKARLELYNAVPAAAAALRAIDQQIGGENKIAAAWKDGAGAAANAANQIKAEQQALSIAAPGTAAYTGVVAALTGKYNELAAASQRVALAQASSVTRDNLQYLQAEISTLGMNYNAREMLLANLKNEQDVKRQYPNLSDVEVAARVRELGAVQEMTLALNQQKAGVDAIAGAFSESFNTIGNAMAQAFVQGQGAAVNWKNVMASVIQQVMQKLTELSVLNPLLNELFGGNRPTIDSAVKGLGQGSGALSGLARWLSGGASAAGPLSSTSAITAAGGFGAASSAAATAAADADIAFASSFSTIPIGHVGGVIGVDPLPMRSVHPAYFDDAPRYHAGLANDEIAAILQKGERVLTIAQTKNFDHLVGAMGKIAAAVHHDGGIAGHALRTRDLGAELFAHAPRFHDGVGNDGIGALLSNFSTMSGTNSAPRGPGRNDGADIHVHLHMANGQSMDQVRQSGPQTARAIGKLLRAELQRGRV